VKRILEGVKGNPGNFDFRIFDDITDMLNELENRRKEGYRKIALIRSFTEYTATKFSISLLRF